MKNIKPFMIIAILAMLFVGCPDDETKSDDDFQNTTQQSKITSLQVAVNEETGTSIDLSQSKYGITDYNATINKAITINGAGQDFGNADLTADVSGITLKGMTNVKTLTASANIGNGSLKIASSSLSSLNILGGGSHSIYIEDHTTIDILTVNKEVTSQSDEFVRLVIDDTVSIGKIIVQSGLLIDVTGDGSVNLENVEFDISGNTAAPIAVSSKVTVDVTDDIETVKVVISDEDIPEAALTIHAIKNTDLTTDFVTSVFEILVAPLSDTAKTALEAELDPKLDSAVTEDINIELEDLVESYGTKHRIVCENNIGAADLPIIIDLSTDYILPTVEVTGARFIGWSVVTDDGTTDLTDNILRAGAYTGKITLAMRWKWNIYTVTFKDGDTVLSTQDVTFDFTATAPTDPTKDSTSTVKYTFAYWYSNDDSERYSFDTPVTAPLTLYAKWNEIPLYSITVNQGDHGTVTASQTSGIEAGIEITLTAEPAENYVLDTWSVTYGDTYVTVTNNKFTMASGNVTVSARFIEVVSYQEASLDGSIVTYTTKMV
ncbi:MAG: InlB B-repeat-containing protein, partial [Spirochaetales bacterium]|nr:InlB B-repeat-containing protein [Spirochaetales bacterium]